MSVIEVIPVVISTARVEADTTAVSPGRVSAAVIPPISAMRSAAFTVVARWCAAAFSTWSAGALNIAIDEAPRPGLPEHFPEQNTTEEKNRDGVVEDSTWHGMVMRAWVDVVVVVADVDVVVGPIGSAASAAVLTGKSDTCCNAGVACWFDPLRRAGDVAVAWCVGEAFAGASDSRCETGVGTRELDLLRLCRIAFGVADD